MSKVPYIPKGYNTVTPYLIIKGAAQAIEFYKKALGAEVVVRMDGPGGSVMHAELQIGDSRIMLGEEMPQMGYRSASTLGASPVGLYLYFPDCDSVVKKAIAEGAKLERPVQDQFYGDRNGTVHDPFGHVWTIATHVEDVSDADMKERMKKMRGSAA
jgi:PhnB protein